MTISIINGPNLNLLGKREPELYGVVSFDDFLKSLRERFSDITLEYYQSNIEGELIDEIQRAGFSSTGIILNPGGYTHTSVAIGDAVAAIKAPVVEVHISNVHAREEFRRQSYVSPKAVGTICGLGLEGYALALQWLTRRS
jgi:3-dehydroquinate dehydratase-2